MRSGGDSPDRTSDHILGSNGARHGRITATAIHLSLCVAAGVGFALFVIPRWWELMGETSHTLGTIIRIATGVSVALAALPVVLTLLRTRAPGAQTPAPALTLRMWSAGAHVVAGALIIATAIAEIWVSLDAAGPGCTASMVAR